MASERELDARDASLALLAIPATFLLMLGVFPLLLRGAAALSGVDLADEEQSAELLTTLAGMAAALFGFQLLLAAAAIVVARMSHRPLRERLGLGAGRLRPATALCLAGGSLFVAWPLELLLVEVGVEPGPALDSITTTIQARPVLTAITFSLFPGVCEELFFRGLVQGALSRVARPVVAIGLPAVIFGAMHLDPLQSPVAALLGAWFGWLAWRAGSLRLAVGAHVLNNFVVVVAMGRLGSPEGEYAEFLHQPVFVLIGLASGASLLAGILLLRRENSQAS